MWGALLGGLLGGGGAAGGGGMLGGLLGQVLGGVLNQQGQATPQEGFMQPGGYDTSTGPLPGLGGGGGGVGSVPTNVGGGPGSQSLIGQALDDVGNTFAQNEEINRYLKANPNILFRPNQGILPYQLPINFQGMGGRLF